MKAGQWNDTIRKRLGELTTHFSQAEMARATGISRSSLNEYLKGTRISAPFCSALVKEMKVNPLWLLVGEGAMFLHDVSAKTASDATELLSLVQAMESIAQLRLGALAGDDHKKTLRRLNDSLEYYEQTKEKLNAAARPIYLRLLDDLRRELGKRNTQQAKGLRDAAAQVARLCDDPALNDRFLVEDARLEDLSGNSGRSLELSRRRFFRWMEDGREINDDFFESSTNLCIALIRVGRRMEARRICRAAVTLAGERGDHPSANYYTLLEFLGFLELHLGDMQAALDCMRQSLSAPVDRSNAPTHIRLCMQASYLAGFSGINGLASDWSDSFTKSQNMLYAPLWAEDVEGLQMAADRFVGPKPYHVPADHGFVRYCLQCLAIWKSPKKAAYARIKKEYDGESSAESDVLKEVNTFTHHRTLARFARICGCREEAIEQLELSEDARKNILPTLTHEQIGTMEHYRNALLLIPANTRSSVHTKLREDALTFFDNAIAAGYTAFAQWRRNWKLPAE
ncbi:MAG: helix-turn-helix transcriptional regulator [Planctomycetes bacterium]|nr:helix-turn-helix transcriptional regulator [Planctomycetota bacterium]NUQ34854.1 helix-turn-helix transcriptional regulator [Planctomycetaceae bacterium]